MSSAKRKGEEDDCGKEHKKAKRTDETGKTPETVSDNRDSGSSFLEKIMAHIVLAGIGKARADLFKKNIVKYGGKYQENFDSRKIGLAITHIIVDENMDINRLCRILCVESPPQNCKIVTTLWLSKCIKEKKYVNTRYFELAMSAFKSSSSDLDKPSSSKADDISENTDLQTVGNDNMDKKSFPKAGIMFRAYKKVAETRGETSDADSDYNPSGEEDNDDNAVDNLKEACTQRKLPKGNWVCAQASSSARPNHNKHITDKLEALAKVYENTNDRWRALGYAKAIAALKRHPKTITSFEEARSLHGVGEKLANKVWEIIESGDLQKLNELSSTEEMQAISLFTNIWGVGATTARGWVQQGFRTLDDIRTKANLTRHQKIGLEYYDELLERMTREEAGKIEETVIDAAHSINPGLTVMACGSYRRGKLTCGDVDVLVTHPDGKSHKGIFPKILQKLHDTGFLTDDLVSQEDNGNQQKYLGVCKLPGEDSKHRRLDIIVVPYDEFACASMYFTGSAHFNRSMRNLASKMGMSLSEHSLNVGVVRKSGEKLNKGTPLPTPTEESVFQHLGLPYRSPSERDH